MAEAGEGLATTRNVIIWEMTFEEILEELPKLTPEEREAVMQRALELDESPFTPEEAALIEKRMAEHRANPDSAIPYDETMERVKKRLKG